MYGERDQPLYDIQGKSDMNWDDREWTRVAGLAGPYRPPSITDQYRRSSSNCSRYGRFGVAVLVVTTLALAATDVYLLVMVDDLQGRLERLQLQVQPLARTADLDVVKMRLNALQNEVQSAEANFTSALQAVDQVQANQTADLDVVKMRLNALQNEVQSAEANFTSARKEDNEKFENAVYMLQRQTNSSLSGVEQMVDELQANQSKPLGRCDCYFDHTGDENMRTIDHVRDKSTDDTQLVECRAGFMMVGITVGKKSHHDGWTEVLPFGHDGSKGPIKCCRPCAFDEGDGSWSDDGWISDGFDDEY
eukprot:COSAG02_NODE_9113_length_2325_cov_2.303235_2_plen_306_part_00